MPIPPPFIGGFPPTLEFGRLLDHFVIAMPLSDAAWYGLAYSGLILMVMWLANRTQPTPRWNREL